MVILTGDFNPTSTGLDPKLICNPNGLKQLVTFLTRDSGILDWFCTNRPKLFALHQLPKMGASDHYTVLARPTIDPLPKRETLRKIKFRQSRASNWRSFGQWLTTKDWSEIYSTPSCERKFAILTQELDAALDVCFPWKTAKKHVNDRPWITNNIKRSISKRQSAFTKYGKDSILYKFWRNRVQREIKFAKREFYNNKVAV